MAKTGEELFAERSQRIDDAVRLETPDRVPILMFFSYFASRYAGITYEESFYDQGKWLAATEKAIVDFEPDLYFQPNAAIFTSGKVHEILGNKQIKWPGHGLGPNTPFQFVEGEYVKADEYDAFLDDPSDFTMRTYLPRIFTALEGLSMLPPFKFMLVGYAGAPMMSGIISLPPIADALRALNEASLISMQWTAGYMEFDNRMAAAGYPVSTSAIAIAPFDVISDFMRGMRGAMLDMYRCPDKLLAAQEKILPTLIGAATAMAQMGNNNRVFIPLHRGADGFMSLEQFERFYWPGLKALFLGLIDAGLIPTPLFEGEYDQRLEYLKELPAGKVLGMFDRTDLFKAKKVIGDSMCILGGMPLSLLQTGTPEQVREHTRRLIEEVGEGGGFIMGSSTVLDEAKPELVKAWVDATREYGQYT
ncbi:MAG: hypothetical protein JW854_04330 [Actinobacteria bacterium]|nr:hypothetical protein [Actinomycetota bacterium]